MGDFMSGLFGSFGKLQEKHDDELAMQRQRKQGEYGTYWNAMQSAATRLAELKQRDGLSADEEKEAQQLASQYAWSEQQLNKLTKGSQPLADAFQRIGGFVKQLLSRPSPNGQLHPPASGQVPAQVPAQQPAYDPFAPGENGDFSQASPSLTAPARLQAPPPIQLTPQQEAMALANPAAQKTRQEEIEYQKWLKRGKEVLGEKADPRDLAEYAGSRGTKLPSRAPVGTRQAERWKLPDGTEVDVDKDVKTGMRYDPQGEVWDAPEGAQRVATKTSTARPTIIASDFVTMKDAKALSDAGVPFLSAEGKPVELAKIPDGMVLQKIHYADGRTVYEPRNINDKVVRVNNQVIAVNPAQVQQIPGGAGTVLGVANTGATSTREVVAEDAAGNPIAMPLNSSRTPVTIPVRKGASVPAGAPAAASPSGATPRASGATAPAGGVRMLPGMTPAQGERVRQRVIPVREAATQIFGDPTNPNMKGLVDFAHLASDPQSRERLGKAFRLTLDELSRESGGGHIRADAGPVSVAIGRPLEWVENYFGVPSALAEQRAGIVNKALQNLTPEERELYNSTMATFGTIVGLRSLTKSSAAQAAVSTIEREMPLVGVNTANAEQFMDQLSHLAEIITNGARDKATQAVIEAQTPGLLKRIRDLPAEAKRLKGQMRQPSPNGKLSAPSSGSVRVWNPKTGKFE